MALNLQAAWQLVQCHAAFAQSHSHSCPSTHSLVLVLSSCFPKLGFPKPPHHVLQSRATSLSLLPWFLNEPNGSRVDLGRGPTHHAELGLGLLQQALLLRLGSTNKDADLRAELQDAALQAGDKVAKAADAADSYDRL